MDALAIGQKNAVAISVDTKELIKAGVSDNTLKAYRRALVELDAWRDAELNDSVLAMYITELHQCGKAPSTIAQVVAAVKWQAKNIDRPDVVGAITLRTLAGIRRDGKERGRGQMDGLTWKDVERVSSFAEASRTLAGLRDSALINLMSDCLLRISEVVAVNVGDIKGSTLRIKSSKTDQEGRGEALYICESTRRVIKRYLRKSGIDLRRAVPESAIPAPPGQRQIDGKRGARRDQAVVCRSRRQRIHQWTLAPRRVGGFTGAGGGVRRRYANGW